MENMIEQALLFAINAHIGQTRKDGSTYILHPINVMINVKKATNDTDVIIAGVLHDVIEDGNVTYEELKNKFGLRVADLVMGETETKNDSDGNRLPWIKRKLESLQKLASAEDIGLKILFLADKLANLKSIYEEEAKNVDMFSKFEVCDKNQQMWYYENILKLTHDLENTELYAEYNNMYKLVFGKIMMEDLNEENNKIK